MAFTCRLSPELHERAMAHAKRLGVPLSSVIAVSLLEYLDRQQGAKSAAGAPVGAEAREEVRKAPAKALTRQQRRAMERERAKRAK
jgi:predicted transcriptional regulator